jgi:hypothetical protein
MSVSESIAAASPRTRVAAAVGAVLVVAALAWVGGYASGAFPWLGYAWLSRSSVGGPGGPISIIGETKAGSEFGVSTFLFLRGQTITVSYDAYIRAGSLFLYVYQPYDDEFGDGVSTYVTTSGRGEWKVPVTRTAIYHITVEPSPAKGAGRGWDMSYRAWWGAK